VNLGINQIDSRWNRSKTSHTWRAFYLHTCLSVVLRNQELIQDIIYWQSSTSWQQRFFLFINAFCNFAFV